MLNYWLIVKNSTTNSFLVFAWKYDLKDTKRSCKKKLNRSVKKCEKEKFVWILHESCNLRGWNFIRFLSWSSKTFPVWHTWVSNIYSHYLYCERFESQTHPRPHKRRSAVWNYKCMPFYICEPLLGCNLWVPLLHTIRLWMSQQSNAIVLVVSLTVGGWQWGLPVVQWATEGTTMNSQIECGVLCTYTRD